LDREREMCAARMFEELVQFLKQLIHGEGFATLSTTSAHEVLSLLEAEAVFDHVVLRELRCLCNDYYAAIGTSNSMVFERIHTRVRTLAMLMDSVLVLGDDADD
jgi:hypothetical protein